MSDIDDSVQTAPAKHEVLEALGEASLVLPALLNEGLEANNRAKYLLSLLQTARARADAPGHAFASLHDERVAAGVLDAEFDVLVEQARHIDGDTYFIPAADRISADLVAAINGMLAPLAVAQASDAPDPGRLAALAPNEDELHGEHVRGSYIDRITSADRDAGDSLHLLVMDTHRALNRLQTRVATTNLAGAAVYGLDDDDAPLVTAFMAGVHATEALKFEHPGLTTTATRAGPRLLIQNDLGTTNAHVVVLSVEGLSATVTYTDVHRRRLEFFESMLNVYDVRWSGAERRRGGPAIGAHQLATGRFDAGDAAELEAYLRHIGSRLVFVLDWNRARKRLSSFLPGADAVALLRWAADANVGHMAFLMLGGERLVYDAVELAERVPARYGEPLVDILGREVLLDITRFALRAATEGMLAGKSPLLIRDEIRVEVLRHIEASLRRLLDASAEHASLLVECAQTLQAVVLRLGSSESDAFAARAAARAGRCEHRADEILNGQRAAARRVDQGERITALTTTADDAVDDLEEAIFLLTLLPTGAVGAVRPLIEPLAAIAVMSAREHLKALEIAREVISRPAPEDLEDFLIAVDRVAALEHEADTTERAARAGFVTDAPDFRSLYIADSVSSGVENATDSMLLSTLGLRDLILGQISAP